MSKKLWGGRFSKTIDPIVEQFTQSIHYDQKLAAYDLIGSIAHVQILKKTGYLTKAEAQKLVKELKSLYKKVKNLEFAPNGTSEDIHTAIQNALHKKVGELALKLHTARSRNDQVVVATKLYCKISLLELQVEIAKLAASIAETAERNKRLIIPGFTHMQHAQPVYLKDYLSAYVEMLKRDELRLDHVSNSMKVTMGAGALAGTPIDGSEYDLEGSKFLKDLGDFGEIFDINPTVNSIDSVSDRDFVIEILSALSILGMHLSRFAEDLIIWSTKEFDFVEIDEAFCTGSSLMPQKKNADSLEMIRGYAGRLYGNLMSVLTMMKGLPLTYNRDMQLDKEPLFNSIEVVSQELRILSRLVKTLVFNKDKIAVQLKDESLYATDLVYYLVDKGLAFKTAHTIVGKLVKFSIDKDLEIKHMTQEQLKLFCDKFVKKDIAKLFDPEVSVKSKRSIKR